MSDCPLKKAALSDPDRTAIFSADLSISFLELDQKVDRLAESLSPLIRPKDRIAALLPNGIDWITLFFASWRLQAVFCPLNTRLPSAQIASCISRLSPALFIDSLDKPFQKRPSLPEEKPLALLLFTSGTTGTPKIAALSLPALLANAEGAISFFNLKPGDEWLVSLPLFHVGGIGILLRCVLAKAAMAFDENRESITHLSYVPTQLYRKTPVYKNLRCLMLGGAPIPTIPERLPVYLSYGLTEMGSVVAASLRDYFVSPLPDRKIKIAPDGEILVKGKTLFEGYWENGNLNLPLDPEGWFATRDIGYLKDGKLTLVGRKDRQFISGGENIQPEEIEKELLKLPHVIDAFVKPESDSQFGARPAAFVQTSDPSFNLAQMQKALLPHLPKYKIPIKLTLCEAIPKKGAFLK